MSPDKCILALVFEAIIATALAADSRCDSLPLEETVAIPHEYNCTLYYECKSGSSTILECDTGLYFNKDTLACDFPGASGCKMATDPLCSGLPGNEVVPFPHETNCSLYYECFNGNKTLLSCDGDLYFNNKTQSCDFPNASGCKNVAETCKGINLDYFPHPSDCSMYIECFNEDSYEMKCPTGFYFDSKSKMCVLPEDSDCGVSPTPPWTTPHPICWGVKPGEVTLTPYDGDCRKYWRCEGSHLSEEMCSPGFLFDADRQMCDFPSTVSCDDSTRTPDPHTPTPPPITSTPSQSDDPRCVNETGISYWPHPVDCHRYIECYGSASYEMDCPPGLYFSDTIKRCVDPRDSDCGKTTSTEGTTYTMPTGWTPHPDCPWPGSDGLLLPFPGDCTKYYECAEGKKVEMPCPPGLFWNDGDKICDYPYQANCPYVKLSFFDMIFSYFKNVIN